MLVPGVPTVPATTRVQTTRTTGAGTTCTPRAPLITDTDAHTATTTSSARPLVALSLWTVLVLGRRTDLANMFRPATRMRDAGPTSTQSTPPITVTHARSRTTTFLVRRVAALSLWTVLDLGLRMELARTLLLTTRTGGAGCTSTPPMLLIVVRVVHTTTTTSSARPLVALSLWTALVRGLPTDLAIPLPLDWEVASLMTFRKIGGLCWPSRSTRSAGCTRLAETLLTTDTAARTRTTTSLAQPLDAVSP